MRNGFLAVTLMLLCSSIISGAKAPSVIGPTKNHIPQMLDPVFSWKPVERPGTYYEIRIAEDPNFSVHLIHIKTTLSSVSLGLPYFVAGRPYYWTLRAAYPEGSQMIFTSWSHEDRKDKEFFRFYIANDATGYLGYQPEVIYLKPDSVFETLQPVLKWIYPDHSEAQYQVKNIRNEWVSPKIEQLSYLLEISAQSDFSTEKKTFRVQKDSSRFAIRIPWLKQGRKYYWRVKAEYFDPEKMIVRESGWTFIPGTSGTAYSFRTSETASGSYSFNEGQKEEQYERSKLNNAQRLTPENYNCFSPAVTKDGQKLAYCSNRTGQVDIYEMSLADRLTGAGIQKTFTTKGKNCYNPFFLSNGEVAYYSNRMGEYFWILSSLRGVSATIRYDGLSMLDDDSSFELFGSCSTDSKMVFCARTRNSDQYDIYMKDFNSGDLSFLTQGMFPDIRNDDRIVYSNNNESDPENYEIMVCILDKNGVVDRTSITIDAARDYDPAFSPDGTRIAFASTRSGNSDIWIMDSDGTNLTQLTFHPMVDRRPQWIDNSTIVFQSNRENENKQYINGIWKIDAPKTAN